MVKISTNSPQVFLQQLQRFRLVWSLKSHRSGHSPRASSVSGFSHAESYIKSKIKCVTAHAGKKWSLPIMLPREKTRVAVATRWVMLWTENCFNKTQISWSCTNKWKSLSLQWRLWHIPGIFWWIHKRGNHWLWTFSINTLFQSCCTDIALSPNISLKFLLCLNVYSNIPANNVFMSPKIFFLLINLFLHTFAANHQEIS